MYLRVQVITPPAAPIISLDLLRQHTRIDSTYDDGLLGLYLASATTTVEAYLNRSLLTRTLRMVFSESHPPSSWMGLYNAPYVAPPIGWQYLCGGYTQRPVMLVYGPPQAILSYTYRALDDAADTVLDPSAYVADLDSQPACIRLLNTSAITPGLTGHSAITYTAGYGDDPSTVPIAIQHAIMLTVARAYEHRGDDDGDALLSRAARSLLDPYRIAYFG